jgi:uncharacterized protein DUF5670
MDMVCSNVQTRVVDCGMLGRGRVKMNSRLQGRDYKMLYTIAVILLIAWLLGFVGTFTIGPIIHVLLVVAVVLVVVGLLGGRRTLA